MPVWVQSVCIYSNVFWSSVCLHLLECLLEFSLSASTQMSFGVQSVCIYSNVFWSSVCLHLLECLFEFSLSASTRMSFWVQSVCINSSLYLSFLCLHFEWIFKLSLPALTQVYVWIPFNNSCVCLSFFLSASTQLCEFTPASCRLS